MKARTRKPTAMAGGKVSPGYPASGSRKPRAIPDLSSLSPEPDSAAQRLPVPMPPQRPRARRKLPLLAVLAVALSGLMTLAAGLAADRLIRDLFARSEWLGLAASVLAFLALFAILALAFREIRGFWRLGAIEHLRKRAAAANEADNAARATSVIHELDRLYAGRPDTAQGRAQLAAHAGEIIDGSDLIALAERDLLAPIDRVARKIIMDSAKRVSVVTAVSPRALIDLAFVLMENLRLIRRISELYGGRPGTLGLWRLAGRVVGHLATTGAIAVGDGVVQQLIGHGLAARLSARLGEGVVNGLLTARIGLASIDLCRPIAFIHQKRPGISGFLSELAEISGPREKRADGSQE